MNTTLKRIEGRLTEEAVSSAELEALKEVCGWLKIKRLSRTISADGRPVRQGSAAYKGNASRFLTGLAQNGVVMTLTEKDPGFVTEHRGSYNGVDITVRYFPKENSTWLGVYAREAQVGSRTPERFHLSEREKLTFVQEDEFNRWSKVAKGKTPKGKLRLFSSITVGIAPDACEAKAKEVEELLLGLGYTKRGTQTDRYGEEVTNYDKMATKSLVSVKLRVFPRDSRASFYVYLSTVGTKADLAAL